MWSEGSSTGRGTIVLLAGETSDSLNELYEIAGSIDVASRLFYWRVGAPTVGTGLSSFYGFNFSQDGSEGVFTMSPPFRILLESDDAGRGGHEHGRPDDNDDTDDETGDDSSLQNGGGGGGGGNDNLSVTRNPLAPSQLLSNPLAGTVTSLPRGVTKSTEPVSTTRINLSGNEDVPNKSTSGPSSRNTSPASSSLSPAPARRPSNGVIAAIVFGSVAALSTFAGLVWLVLYYRRRLLGIKKSSVSEKNRISEIDGKFKKAELDAEGPEIQVSRVYELDSTREVQEADGHMKPVELDSAAPSPGLSAVDIQGDSADTKESGDRVSKMEGFVTDWASY
ncbi:hypothetical protein F5Y10DRAFT_292100 [Nemania abortiva]|nr:hypothetical protein F5Y10DRAFT_292100 [Nemania abortiva]